MDSICPLKEVDAIVTSENVYVNIQKERSVSKNKWDYKNNKLYEPFLT
jgi:hypothetical protein